MTSATPLAGLLAGAASATGVPTALTVPPPGERAGGPGLGAANAARKKQKVLYLTFDDGPNGEYTRKVLQLLRKYDAKATFFVVGKSAKSGRSLVHAEYAAGHGVANHTWDHATLRGSSMKKFRWEIGRTQRAIKSATGHDAVCLRPPGGATDKYTRSRAAGYDLRIKLWSTDTYDWRRPGAKTIAQRVMHGARDGAVILMHDGGGKRGQTISALKAVLPKLKREGYTFAAMCR